MRAVKIGRKIKLNYQEQSLKRFLWLILPLLSAIDWFLALCGERVTRPLLLKVILSWCKITVQILVPDSFCRYFLFSWRRKGLPQFGLKICFLIGCSFENNSLALVEAKPVGL